VEDDWQKLHSSMFTTLREVQAVCDGGGSRCIPDGGRVMLSEIGFATWPLARCG
jgi:hypothetical protein